MASIGNALVGKILGHSAAEKAFRPLGVANVEMGTESQWQVEATHRSHRDGSNASECQAGIIPKGMYVWGRGS